MLNVQRKIIHGITTWLKHNVKHVKDRLKIDDEKTKISIISVKVNSVRLDMLDKDGIDWLKGRKQESYTLRPCLLWLFMALSCQIITRVQYKHITQIRMKIKKPLSLCYLKIVKKILKYNWSIILQLWNIEPYVSLVGMIHDDLALSPRLICSKK